MSVLSIDLALISYRDVGAALVQSAPSGELTARVIRLTQGGRPTTDALVGWMEQLAEREQVRCRAIDGPLGWRGPDTDSPHSRLSERAVRAPGKTGLPPDGVKPRTYLEFSRLSNAIFERLTARGWRLPADPTGGRSGGIAPAWWMAHAPERVSFVGVPPFRLESSWREGLILVPKDHSKA